MPVELEGIEFKIAQMRQRTGPRTEVIQRHAHPEVAQQAQLLLGFIGIAHQRILGHLDLQLPRLQGMALQDLAQLGHQVGHAELGAAQAHPQHQVVSEQALPDFALGRAAMINPAAQPADQPRLFQQGQEQARRNITDAGVLPAQQRLEPADPPVDDAHLRLVDHIEIAVLDGRAHALFQHQP